MVFPTLIHYLNGIVKVMKDARDTSLHHIQKVMIANKTERFAKKEDV